LAHGDLFTVNQGPGTIPFDGQVTVAKRRVGADYTVDAVTQLDALGHSMRIDFVPLDAPQVGEVSVTQESSTCGGSGRSRVPSRC
jgi:hypothetical protein